MHAMVKLENELCEKRKCDRTMVTKAHFARRRSVTISMFVSTCFKVQVYNLGDNP